MAQTSAWPWARSCTQYQTRSEHSWGICPLKQGTVTLQEKNSKPHSPTVSEAEGLEHEQIDKESKMSRKLSDRGKTEAILKKKFKKRMKTLIANNGHRFQGLTQGQSRRENKVDRDSR